MNVDLGLGGINKDLFVHVLKDWAEISNALYFYRCMGLRRSLSDDNAT